MASRRQVWYGAAVFPVLLLAAGCAHVGGGGEEPRGPRECSAFALESPVVRIRVEPSGGPEELGNDNQIDFARGAVSRTSEYEVRPVVRQGRRLAGYEITDLDGAPVSFDEPVSIRISFSRCNWQTQGRPMWIETDASGRWERIGGAKSEVGKFIKVDVNHFSAFAIAM